MLQNIIEGIRGIMSFDILIFMNIGVMIGIIFGAIPGMTGNLAIVLLMSFTYGMDPVVAMVMLVSIYCGANFGGSIPAILIEAPGTNAAAATMMDGHPLSKKGFPRKALFMALVASTIGGIISSLALLFFAPQLSRVALSFGPPEYFALAVFGLSVIASVSGNNLVKGIISGCFGILVSTVGLDMMTGGYRFTFGNINLYNGIKLVPAMLGVFAISKMIERINLQQSDQTLIQLGDKSVDNLTMKEVRSTLPTILRSSVIGTIIGAIPGTGAAIASYLGYSEAKRRSDHPEEFGTGIIEGIAAPEAANNGLTAATLIPLLTLGIPGGAVAATLLGAFIMHGLVPGPTLFNEQAGTMYAIMVGILLANVFMYLQGRYLLGLFAKITQVPQDLLTPILIVICCAGAYSFANSMFDVYILAVFGFISYLMQKVGFPAVPIVLGVVLGPIAESNLRNALVMSDGSFMIFLQRPISVLFIVLTVVFLYLLKRQSDRMAANASK